MKVVEVMLRVEKQKELLLVIVPMSCVGCEWQSELRWLMDETWLPVLSPSPSQIDSRRAIFSVTT